MNIVQLISSQLGGENLNKLSSLLGESPNRTQSALGAVIPTLLGGLTHVASTPEGAQRLDNIVSQQNPDIAPNFGTAAGAGAGSGATMLSNLFGGGMFNSLTTALGRFTGMGSSTMGSLAGMVAPVAFGGLAKVKQEQGLNASGLAGFLNGQKQNIAAAMPSGLSSVLGSIPGLGGFAQKAPAEKAAEPAYASAGAAPTYTGTASGGGARPGASFREHRGVGRWILPLLILVAIIWALWSWSWGHRHARTMMQNPAAPAAASVSQFSSSLQNDLSSATSTLSGVTDAASAQKATPQLAQLNNKLASLKPQFDQLSPAAKSSLTGTLQPTIARLQQLSSKARGVPGVNDQFKTTLDQFDSNLAGLGGGATTNP